jgi:glutamate-1-semialdehyde 2,1-aminomutase
VRPDLVTLGKVIGGGLPADAFGRRADLMALVAPEGPVYQAGTYSGNPLSMAAGLATLRALREEPEHFRRAEARTDLLAAGLRGALSRRSVPGTVNAIGSMWTVYFGVTRVASVEDARGADRDRFARFFHGMLERGVYLPPSRFESAFLSSAHTDEDVDATLEAAEEAMEGIAG